MTIHRPVIRRLAAASLISATALLVACGGGGSATPPAPTPAPQAAANTLTVSGATGGQGANNGAKTVTGITATTSLAGGKSYTNVVGSLGTASDSLSVVFETATGIVTDVSLHFVASPALPNYLAAICGPCTGVTVNTSAKTITFVATAVNNGGTPPVTQAAIDGAVGY
jgi:hypothetical protein